MKRTGFTLVELLVVIGVIALLMAIFVPVLNKVRERAVGVVCAHNSKSLLLAWYTYALDNNDRLVGGGVPVSSDFKTAVNALGQPLTYWVEPPQLEDGTFTGIGKPTIEDKLRGIERGSLFDYVRGVDVYHCPADKRTKMPAVDWRISGMGGFRSYSVAGGMNGEVIGTLDTAAKVYADIKTPAGKYVFMEESDPRGWNIGSWMLNPTADGWLDPVAAWHNKSNTLGFADGHAEVHRWADGRTIELAEAKSWTEIMNVRDSQPDNRDLRYMQAGYFYVRR